MSLTEEEEEEEEEEGKEEEEKEVEEEDDEEEEEEEVEGVERGCLFKFLLTAMIGALEEADDADPKPMLWSSSRGKGIVKTGGVGWIVAEEEVAPPLREEEAPGLEELEEAAAFVLRGLR